MVKKYLKVLVLVAFCGVAMSGPGLAQAAEPAPTQVFLEGETLEEGYSLKIGYTPEAKAPQLAGLVVEALPSGRILAAVWNSDFDTTLLAQRKALSPLVTSETSLALVRAKFVFAFDPAADDRIVVHGIQANGTKQPLMGAKVDLRAFEVQTQFNF